MSKKALLALMIAVLLPLISYLILQVTSDKAVVMPRKFLLDSVVTTVRNGKEMQDSIWHKTSDIKLINQLGDTVNLYSKQGKIIVLDFFFTSCRSICPSLTHNMVKLQRSFMKGGDVRNKIDTSIVQFVSMSIDPQRDSVSVLKDYADRFGVNPDNYWMLTGSRDSIYRFAFEELKVDKFSMEPISPDFVHTSRFVLIDRDMIVRGYYDGLDRDSTSLKQLARDIGLLMLEKNKKKPSELFTEIINLKWLWLIIVVLVIIFAVYLSARRKING
ncbi:MAG: SCO family protein [Bacteroidota bacterium]|nr:SCO family protein [Bacteroidota bacterium]